MSGKTVRLSRLGLPPEASSRRTSKTFGADPLTNLTSQVVQLSEIAATPDNVTKTYATVLSVILPDTYDQVTLRKPVSDLGPEGSEVSELTRLCRIIFHDMTVPMLPIPAVLGAAAGGYNESVIEMHESMGKVCYPRTADLAIPSPGDIIIVDYMETGNYQAPIYVQHYIETPNPGVPATASAASMTGPSSSIFGGLDLSSLPLSEYSSSDEAIKALLDIIAKSEGGYNSMNQGTDDDQIVGSTHNASEILPKNLTEMKISEIQHYQALDRDHPQRAYAVGRYQIVPGTMTLALNNSGISPDQIFSEAIQDELGKTLIFNGQRPKLAAFLNGTSEDLHAAMLEISMEWASFPHPDTGNSYYPPANRSGHTVEEVAAALLSARGGISGT